MLSSAENSAPEIEETAARAGRPKRVALPVLFAVAMIAALAPVSANAIPVIPDFGAATFVPGAPVDNPFFPLLDTRTRIFKGGTERSEVKLLGAGPTILGVQTTKVRDRVFDEGLLVEDTFDFYAQDTAGNVWYFGEDVSNFEYDDEGNVIGTNNDGAWRAGVNDALPGFIMPSDLTVGFNYFQEFAPNDGAVDQATTFSLGNFISIGVGDFSNVLQVLETTALEPNARAFKYYAPGIGLIMEQEGLDPSLQNPELTLELTAIPEPSTSALLGAGLAVLLCFRRRIAEITFAR